MFLLSVPLSVSQRGYEESSSLRQLKKVGKKQKKGKLGGKSSKKKVGKKSSKEGNGEDSCIIEHVEMVLNRDSGEPEERVYYTTDPSCDRILSCEEKSSDILSCQQNAAGGCVCEKTCVAKSTLSVTCSELSSDCVCAAAWIMNMFANADTDKDEKLSQEEVYKLYDRTSCVESFVYDGVTYEECTTAGYSEDTVIKYPWCSVKVDNEGNHVLGSYKYCDKDGFINEWMTAISFDANGDNMLSIAEVIAFEEATYGSQRSLNEDARQGDFLSVIRQQLDSAFKINLNEDFPTNFLSNWSSGALRVKKAFDHFNERNNDQLLGVMVIENGINVAEFYNKARGVTRKSKFYVWSVTKTVLALLIGQMLKEHPEISYETTLPELLPEAGESCYSWFWGSYECYHRQEAKQEITLLQLITQSSGMHDCGNLYNLYDKLSLGGTSATVALDLLYYKERNIRCPLGDWSRSWYGQCYDDTPDSLCSGENYHYILASNILSYIMLHITGMAPQDYIKTKLTRELGLSDSDYEWCDNGEGVGSALHGMKLTLPTMAKIGQFYLQQGVARVDDTEPDMFTRKYMNDIHFDNLIKKYVVEPSSFSSKYYNATTQNCVPEENKYDCGNNGYEVPFYSHFVQVDIVRGNYCAIGTAGKIICWTPRKKRVVVIAFDSQDLDSECDQSLLRLASGLGHLEAMDLFQYIDAGLDGGEEYDFAAD